MLKSILNLKGVHELSKKQQEDIRGGAFYVSCKYPDNRGGWGFRAETTEDAVGLDQWCENTGGTTTIRGVRNENVITPE